MFRLVVPATPVNLSTNEPDIRCVVSLAVVRCSSTSDINRRLMRYFMELNRFRS